MTLPKNSVIQEKIGNYAYHKILKNDFQSLQFHLQFYYGA